VLIEVSNIKNNGLAKFYFNASFSIAKQNVNTVLILGRITVKLCKALISSNRPGTSFSVGSGD